jgi:hypothetical protein
MISTNASTVSTKVLSVLAKTAVETREAAQEFGKAVQRFAKAAQVSQKPVQESRKAVQRFGKAVQVFAKPVQEPRKAGQRFGRAVQVCPRPVIEFRKAAQRFGKAVQVFPNRSTESGKAATVSGKAASGWRRPLPDFRESGTESAGPWAGFGKGGIVSRDAAIAVPNASPCCARASRAGQNPVHVSAERSRAYRFRATDSARPIPRDPNPPLPSAGLVEVWCVP